MNLARAGDEEFILRLREIILANLENENFGVENLCRETGMSHSALNRRLHAISGESINHFISEVRLQKAMELLQQHEFNTSEIAYMTGFGSPSYFTTSFHKRFGFPPGDLKRKENSNSDEISKQQVTGFDDNPDDSKTGSFRFGILRKKDSWLFAAGIMIGLILVYLLYTGISEKTNKDSACVKSVVVLPFVNLSNNADNQYFADGITENILNLLFRIRELRVVSRTTSEQFRAKPITVPEIAKSLNVNYVLEGSVYRSGNKVEIFVQLIDARIDQHIMSEKFESDMTDIFEVQSDIAKKVASELEAVISNREMAMLEKSPTKNIAAYDDYLWGRYFLKKRSETDVKRAMEYFESSIRHDSAYALAYTGLADVYWVLSWWGWGPRDENYARSKMLINKALQLDDGLCEAHTVLGKILLWSDWNWNEAQKELKLALELNPNYAEAYFYYSEYLDIIGNNQEARGAIDKGLELDPFFATWNSVSAMFYEKQCNYEAALKAYEKTLELQPEWISIYLNFFKIYFKQGQDSSALLSLRKWMVATQVLAKDTAVIQKVYLASGKKGLMNLAIDLWVKNSFHDLYTLAGMYALAGKREEALNCLEKMMRDRNSKNSVISQYSDNIPRIANDADFNSIRSDPRFLALIRQMGLTPYYHPGLIGRK